MKSFLLFGLLVIACSFKVKNHKAKVLKEINMLKS